MPDQLFELTFPEYVDMVNAKITLSNVEDDKAMERMAWQTSLLMSATGNYGKKGIDAGKLYTRQLDNTGNSIKKNEGTFTPIDRQTKENKLNELIAKFNKK